MKEIKFQKKHIKTAARVVAKVGSLLQRAGNKKGSFQKTVNGIRKGARSGFSTLPMIRGNPELMPLVSGVGTGAEALHRAAPTFTKLGKKASKMNVAVTARKAQNTINKGIRIGNALHKNNFKEANKELSTISSHKVMATAKKINKSIGRGVRAISYIVHGHVRPIETAAPSESAGDS